MNNKMKRKREKTERIVPKSIFVIIITLFLVGLYYQPVIAQNKKQNNKQEKKQAKQRNRAQLFVDEDGDGFNDNLPDDDGDGIPNMIDPDFKGHSAESLYMHRYIYSQTIEAERNRYQQTNQHGEPGQYGPNDSTGHGQGDGRGGHQGNSGSGNEGDGGGQGGQGGSGGQGGGSGYKTVVTPDDNSNQSGTVQRGNTGSAGRKGAGNNRSSAGNNRSSESGKGKSDDTKSGKGQR